MAGFPNLAQLMGSDIVTVYVGPREKRYSVHKTLLTSQSEYFEKALNGKFKEADEQTIRLPEDSPDAFDLLIGWLYQNQIPVLGYGPGPFDEFPRGIFVGATKLGNAALPPNRGTGSVAYRAHEEVSATIFVQPQGNNNMRDRFDHIGTQTDYNQYSPEELRLEDYALNHRFSDFSRPSPENAVIPQPFPVSPGRIDGIPYCSPIEPIMESEEAHQLALLRLCLFAETICWTNLFNIAMSTYIQGESFLAPRPMPTEHIELIYERAHPESPCRKFAAYATISQINAAGQIDRNMDLVEQWPSFLEDIFKRLRLGVDVSLAHKPKVNGACDYHVHDAKHRPEDCPAVSETRRFILNARAPTRQTFVTKPQNSARSSGGGSESTGSGDGGTTVGSSGEIRYTTYLPNTGYTTRTLGYDDTTGGPPHDTFGRPGDTMDWGGPWLKGAGFGQTPTQGFGTGGFGNSSVPFGTPRTAFGTSGPFSHFVGVAASASTNPTTTGASSSSAQGGGLDSSGTNILSPQASATAPLSANSSPPQAPVSTEPTVSHNSAAAPNTPASTAASPAITTPAGSSSEAGASNAAPQNDTGDGTGSISQGSNPIFGRVSPLASPLPSLTARSTSAGGIFGQRLASSSSTTNPGSFFPTSGPAARTNMPTSSGFTMFSPPQSSSTSGFDASRAAPPSTNTGSTSPFGLLGARSTPAPSSHSLFGSTSRAPDAGVPAQSSSSNPFGFRNEPSVSPSNAATTATPSNAGTLFGSPPTNLFGLRNASNVSPLNSATGFVPPKPKNLFGIAPEDYNTNLPDEGSDR
ncbi:hypothetical protein V499_00756 [Pseudogymnoascus sp. VKM F-103]|uniref:BTB domain-containing protein n=1 Tax=Pseudogymnoascus verrucosus TaxID=342668 RepID=A0A1B8G913_9PEZI|nr:uncharacterized protein VE01_09399 [Pseudogymnoascus verrucosus]KFY80385.1 hypothetical protein V499_00756 [Pseudogymnoascus sp. VKM F-103]OBT92307.1 hypothetical protein VE01_09399 [Pseudogymnoascus verrucosus]